MLEMKKDGAENYTTDKEAYVERMLRQIYAEAREKNQDNVFMSLKGAYEAIEILKSDLQRLTNHVNREIGVAQETPLHVRLSTLEEEPYGQTKA